jgi:uncharacterized protein
MIEIVKNRVKEHLHKNDNAHGFEHVERVFNLAMIIQEHEGGDPLVIGTSAYMHDWCAYKGRVYHVSPAAMNEINTELVQLNFPADKIIPVIDVIQHHEDYDFKKLKEKPSIECQIIQDADRLDAIGAIGIARCFYTSSSLNYPIGTPQDMAPLEEVYHAGQLTSAIQHFYTKLLNLKGSMNTEYAKKLAQGRHDFMVGFLDRFKLEWYAQS